LRYVGQLNRLYVNGRVAKEFSLKKKPSYLKEIDSEQWEKWNKRIEDKFFWNVPTSKALDISEMKIDEVRPWPKIDDFRKVANAYVDKVLEVPLTHKEWTDEQVYQHLDLDKTPALPWRFMGHRTREDFFKSEEWINIKDNVEALAEIGHIYKSCPKEEWSDIADFYDNKTRTFLVPGAHVLFWQLKIYGQGNENLKNWVWSKYGFNPFSGNVHRMAREMLLEDENGEKLYPIIIFWDVSGYDRKIYLHFVAERRYRYWLKANEHSKNAAHARWVADGLKTSLIVFHNGDICYRDRGNNSGSGMTTANNIEAGFEVVTDLLVCSYHRKYGEIPSYDLIYKQLVKLYGDDNASALMIQFEYMLDSAFIADRLLNGHGLKLKLTGGGKGNPLSELSFLGFNFHLFENQWWIPKWNLDRLLVPLIYSKEKLRLDIFLQRFYAILILSFAHPEWAEIRSVYAKVLQWANEHSGNPSVKALIKLGIPTYTEMKYFYIGLESGVSWPKYARKHIMEKIDSIEDGRTFILSNNYKGKLQEWCVVRGLSIPTYIHTSTGPAHSPTFLTTAMFQGEQYSTYTSNKKEGEQRIAYQILSGIAALNNVNERNKAFNQNRVSECKTGEEKGESRDYMFFYNFMVQYRSYIDLTPEERIYHPLSNLFDCGDKQAAARLAAMFKAGSFNPYGNGQAASKYYITKPGIISVGGAYSCSSTCMVPGSVNIMGSGDTAQDAFADWLAQVNAYINLWEPPQRGFIFDMFKVLREQGKPTCIVTEYSFIWEDDENIAFKKFWTKYKEGSFNPYGNGQTSQAIVLKQNEMGFRPVGRGLRLNYIDVANEYRYEDDHKRSPSYQKMMRFDQLVAFMFELLQRDGINLSEFETDRTRFMGSFNPYGNGQPPMAKARWLSLNPKFQGRDVSFINMKYQAYVKKAQKNAKQPLAVKEMKKVMNAQAPPRKYVIPKNNIPKREKKYEKGYDNSRVKMTLSGCAKGYATAQMCPFFYKDGSCAKRVPRSVNMKELPCIPSFPTVKSRKMSAWADFEFGFSDTTGGVAWCAAAPWRMANTEANNDDVSPVCIFFNSTQSHTTPAFPNFDTGSTSWPGGHVQLNSDYSNDDLILTSQEVGIRYRPVGFGLRIRYIGAVMTAAGMIHGVVHPDHTSLSGLSVDDISQYETYFQAPIADMENGKWTYLTHNPVNEADLSYAGDTIANATWPNEPFKNHYMGFLITGAPPGTSFHGQVFGIYEVEGASVRGKTISTADPQGLAVVANSISPDLQNKNNKEIPIKSMLSGGASDMSVTSSAPKGETYATPSPTNIMNDIAKVMTAVI